MRPGMGSGTTTSGRVSVTARAEACRAPHTGCPPLRRDSGEEEGIRGEEQTLILGVDATEGETGRQWAFSKLGEPRSPRHGTNPPPSATPRSVVVLPQRLTTNSVESG
jgi:hypothetical protein